MSLLFWMPMTTDDLINQGLSNAIPVNRGTTVSQNGKLGKCRYFDGNVNGIDTGFKESFGTGDFSIAAWFYLVKNTSRSYQPIITNKSAGAASVGCGIYFNKSQMKFLWSTADGSNATEVWMSTALTEDFIYDKWHHIVMVRDSNDSKKGYFYIDSVRYELASIPPIRNVTNTSVNFCIGGMPSDYASYRWSGSMNDVRIYDHALSPREVKEISKGLVLHYTLAMPGGTNIVKQSSIWRSGSCASGITSSVLSDGTYQVVASSGNSYWNSSWFSTLDGIEDSFAEGDKFTISFTIKSDNNTKLPTIYIKSGMGYYSMIGKVSSQWSTIYYTGTWKKANTLAPHLGWGDIVGTYQFKNWKIEKGDHPTPWIPHVNDTEYTKMGFNNNIEYDVSGFCNNGTKIGALTYSSDTPKYWTSTNTTSGTYINAGKGAKVTDAITVNLWINCKAWSNPISCTEGGGWNFEQSGGYIRFPVYVSGVGYVISQSPTVTYSSLQNNWHMLTGTYDRTNVKLYVDGVLQATVSPSTTGKDIGYNANNAIFIGAEAGGSDTTPVESAYTGGISDVRIYSTALSADDILELYNTPISLTSNGVLMTSGELTGA